MKLNKPLFSLSIIAAQLVFSLIELYSYVQWGKDNPELDALVQRHFYGDSLFAFVLVIALCEMGTATGLFKTLMRILLTGIVFGIQLSGLVPIEDFFHGVYNTAWFSAYLALVVLAVRAVKFVIAKRQSKQLDTSVE